VRPILYDEMFLLGRSKGVISCEKLIKEGRCLW
jgi:hypothetical protein